VCSIATGRDVSPPRLVSRNQAWTDRSTASTKILSEIGPPRAYRRVRMAVLPALMTLLEAAKRGDNEAFEILLKPLLEPGYRLAGGMLQDHQAAQDAVQEAAFKAWRKLGQLRDGSEMRPWFLGIVANECRSVRRSRWSSVVTLLLPARAEAESVAADTVLSRIELRRALRTLDEKKRLALVLHWYLDLPLQEIATITGSSVHAVEGQVQRGMHELRQRMEEHRG
jgi:RNA polymerase sigma factor (sigma-70 family)